MKKQKRKRRSRRKTVAQNRHTNRHHIFYQRRYWSKRTWSYALRNHQFCIAELPIKDHNVIHAELLTVPIPPEFICENTVREINRLWDFGAIGPDTPIQVRLNVLICLLDYVATDTANALKQQKNTLNKLDKPH